MKTVTAILLTFLVLASHVMAQPGPTGPPPTLKSVVSTKPEKGEVIYLDTATRAVAVEVDRVIIVNGQQVTQKVTEYRTVLEQRHVMLNAAKSRIITPDGKQLPIDEVWKRLKKNAVFAISSDGTTPAQVYLRALSAETLVIIPLQQNPIVEPPPAPPKKQ